METFDAACAPMDFETDCIEARRYSFSRKALEVATYSYGCGYGGEDPRRWELLDSEISRRRDEESTNVRDSRYFMHIHKYGLFLLALSLGISCFSFSRDIHGESK